MKKVADFIETNGYTVTTAAGSTAGSQKYGVRGIPDSVLIGIDGTILYHGSPSGISSGKIKSALKGARKPSKGGYMAFRPTMAETSALASVFKQIKQGKLGKAYASALAIVKKESTAPAGHEAAQSLAREIASHAELILGQAQEQLDALNLVTAIDVYETVASEMKGTEYGEQAKKQLAHIDEDDKLQEELKAAEAFAKVKKSAGRLSTSKKKKKYKEFAKKYKGSRAAEKALAIARK